MSLDIADLLARDGVIADLSAQDKKQALQVLASRAQDITGLSPLELNRRGVGRTFQTLQVFGKMSVRDNLIVAAQEHKGTMLSRMFAPGDSGLGDKADRWGVIFTGAQQVATGSRHTVALRSDGTLWGWGSDDGTTPRLLMEQVDTMAAGDTETVALLRNGTVWQWKVGTKPTQLLLNR